MIQVQSVSVVTEKLKLMIEEWARLEGKVKVRIAEPVNKSMSNVPWIGIYRQQQLFESRTLGLGAGYRRHNIGLVLVLQEASMKDGEDCERKMERLISEVVSAICSDESIRGTVDCIGPEPFVVTYSSYQVEGANFFQEAVLQLNLVTNVSAS